MKREIFKILWRNIWRNCTWKLKMILLQSTYPGMGGGGTNGGRPGIPGMGIPLGGIGTGGIPGMGMGGIIPPCIPGIGAAAGAEVTTAWEGPAEVDAPPSCSAFFLFAESIQNKRKEGYSNLLSKSNNVHLLNIWQGVSTGWEFWTFFNSTHKISTHMVSPLFQEMTTLMEFGLFFVWFLHQCSLANGYLDKTDGFLPSDDIFLFQKQIMSCCHLNELTKKSLLKNLPDANLAACSFRSFSGIPSIPYISISISVLFGKAFGTLSIFSLWTCRKKGQKKTWQLDKMQEKELFLLQIYSVRSIL